MCSSEYTNIYLYIRSTAETNSKTKHTEHAKILNPNLTWFGWCSQQSQPNSAAGTFDICILNEALSNTATRWRHRQHAPHLLHTQQRCVRRAKPNLLGRKPGPPLSSKLGKLKERKGSSFQLADGENSSSIIVVGWTHFKYLMRVMAWHVSVESIRVFVFYNGEDVPIRWAFISKAIS